MSELANRINNTIEKSVDDEYFLELQRRDIIIDYFTCALWEYNISEKCQYQYKKLDGKWMEHKEPIPNYRETVIAWGLIHPDDVSVFNAYCDSLDAGESNFSYEMRLIGDNSDFIWIRYTGKAVYDRDGNPYSVVGTTYDVSADYNGIRSRNDNIDSLTGLLDASCLDLMNIEIDNLQNGENAAFVLFDIDLFGKVNNKYGMVYGDYILSQVGRMIKNEFSKTNLLGRLGGDQFALFEKNTDGKKLGERISALVKRVADKTFNKGVRISLSVGAAMLCDCEAKSLHALIQNAETALYIVKDGGGRSFHIYRKEDKSAMPPDCTQIKFCEKYESRSSLYLSGLTENEKRLFDFAFDSLNSNADFYSAVTMIFTEFGKQYGLDMITLACKKSEEPVKLPVVWNDNFTVHNPEKYEEHINRHWGRLSVLLTVDKQLLVCDNVDLLKDSSFFGDSNYHMNTTSMVICGIFDGEDLVGYISFDYEFSEHKWSENEISVFSAVARMVSTYLIRYMSKSDLKKEMLYSAAILENKNMLAYTVDPKTFEITYASNHINETFGNIEKGDICYKSIMGNNSPCENCPVLMLNDRVSKHSAEIYSKFRNAWFSTTASKIDLGGGNSEYMLCLTDVTQFMDRVQSHDRLTGIWTFDRFEVECMKRFDSLCSGYFVASIKLMRFGEINDDYGFEVGNRVLREIADKFSRSIMSDEAICRCNGSKFFALLKADVYWKVENRLNAMFISVADAINETVPDINISLAAGIYQITPEDKQFNSCLDKANYVRKLVTKKKSMGQSQIRTYDSTLDDEMTAKKEIEKNMYNALVNGEFKVYYQPKVSLETEKICGAEALVRWVKDDGMIISPGIFVPIFEENEFIVEMDFYVYETVLKDMSALIEAGYDVPVISVNVSKQHFFDVDFPDKFTRLVNRYRVPHELIELELTETTFFGNLDHMINIINRLRKQLGFRVSIDDFGSGYSSLNLISILPIDVLKIDGKFFMMNEMSTKNKKVIETILQLAQTLDFDTVSEGVETKEQVDFLKNTNCDAVQGFYYYRPMTLGEMKKALEANR